MAPRSSWKGFIKLSLVSVPVKAYTASQSGADIRLNQLHAECHSRIKYQKTCPVHGEVSNDEIVSGYEFAKGQYVVVDPDEVQKLRKQSDSSIEIQGFIPADEIDPLYYSGRTYYLVPDGPVGQKPYALFRHGMGDEEVVAFGQIILGGRTHKIILRVLEDMIVMTMLDYPRQMLKQVVVSGSFVPAVLRLKASKWDRRSRSIFFQRARSWMCAAEPMERVFRAESSAMVSRCRMQPMVTPSLIAPPVLSVSVRPQAVFSKARRWPVRWVMPHAPARIWK